MTAQRLDGLRHVAWHRDADCADVKSLMDEMDGFVLRTGSRLVEAVADSLDNPFLAGMQSAAADFETSPGIAISRDDLHIQHVGSLPGCATDSVGAGIADRNRNTDGNQRLSGNYRARDLADFFSEEVAEGDFTGPVLGTLGAWADIDLTSLVTAKVSGFMIKDAGGGRFVQPWGGHCTTYSDAHQLGVLEGIERLGAEAPARWAPTELEPVGRRITTDKFGMDNDKWRIPHPDVRHWSQGTSMVTSAPVELPTRLVYFNADVAESHWVQDSSNGCAIGGSQQEAQLFGLLEAIERDAFLASWYGGLPLDEIRAESVTDPVSRSFLNRMNLCGQTVRFFNATVGVEVPTVIAVSTEPDGSACVGAGSHPDVDRALHSALIEVASDFQVVALHRREREAELAAMLQDYSRVQRMEDHADMFAHPDSRSLLGPWLDSDHDVVDLALLKTPNVGHSIEQDIETVITACTAAGFEPIAVPTQTAMADQLSASCWKVVVPGLIPIDFGFSYQRALDMPRLEALFHEFWASKGHDRRFCPYLVPHPFP